MKWNRRERILAIVAGSLAVVTLLGLLFFIGDNRSTTQLLVQETQKRDEVAKKQAQVAAALREAKQLAEWRKRALPSNLPEAVRLYKNWLLTLAGRFNFQKLNITAPDQPSRPKPYTFVTFTVSGRATLGDVIGFLYDFYSAGHLHQIREMGLHPVENSRELEVSMTIQALSLADADRKDKLTDEPGRGLKLANVDEYRTAITKRDLFAAFRETPPLPADNSLDSARYVFITGFTEVDGERQVWIQDRTGGKTWTLSEGGEFQVGRLRGKVRSILPDREVIVDFDGRGRRLRSGENLRGGVEIIEQTKVEEQSAPPGERPRARAGG